ncbi:MAG: long-chain fatty acid--CoA ligase [Candidatus Hydrogenedentes bacterium]|nr:long-chain fatty acid--CoA ligase [Candidatus Hydrogenedentota bacterium]
MNENSVKEAKTISDLFRRRAEASADRVAYEHEVDGAWNPVTWGEYGRAVKMAALGLNALGLEPGERVAVWGDTMPQWTVIDLATMSLGGSTAGIYQTCTPEQGAYIINDAEATVVVVDGPERLEKALAVRNETPSVKYYVTWGEGEDPAAGVYSYAHMLTRGEEAAAAGSTLYEDCVDRSQAEDTAVLIYTSGTTGPPKGALLSHKNCLFCCRAINQRTELTIDDCNIAFLPMSHVAEHVVSFLSRIYLGNKAFFMPDLARFTEVAQAKQPTVIMAVPRLWEKAYAAIMERRDTASPLRQAIFDWGVAQGAKVWEHTDAGRSIPGGLAMRHRLADKLVLSKIRDALGGKVKFLGSGAAPIAKEIVVFFNASGMPLVEAYGMTETAGITHINAPGKYRIGTVGTVLDGLECMLAEDGEILVRGDAIFQGYLNQPEATAEAIDKEGWMHTGDIGEVDEDGFLRITDRKKNLLITAGGKNVAPSNIELLVNRDPAISQVLVIGDRRKFLSALITISEEEIERLRTSDDFNGQSAEEIVQSDEIVRRVQTAVTEANKELARYEQIKKYKILPREFTVEDGEMTPTMKLKRKVIEKDYAADIEAFYAE